MFQNVSEDKLMTAYDWITITYYNTQPVWNKTNMRSRALYALDDMRALFSGVGNNGWWDTDRIHYLEKLRDIIPKECNEVLINNEELEKYYDDREEAQNECFLNDADFDWDEFKEVYGTDIEKMQGNKDGKLYEYTKGLFWGTVEWFINSYATDEERKAFWKLF